MLCFLFLPSRLFSSQEHDVRGKREREQHNLVSESIAVFIQENACLWGEEKGGKHLSPVIECWCHANGKKKTRRKKRDTLFGLLKYSLGFRPLILSSSHLHPHDLLVSPGRHSFNALVIKWHPKDILLVDSSS